jgi:acetyltransferase
MIDEIKASIILDGYRGRPPGDRAALKRLLLICSEIVEAYPDIKEMDLNPVIVYEKGVAIVDARIILKA